MTEETFAEFSRATFINSEATFFSQLNRHLIGPEILIIEDNQISFLLL
ncbi:MAG: hypothetical protein ACFFDI_23975 [Promethearchaeota archaeon]